MAVNKVDINGATVLDLTGDSVTPETLLQGATAHDASGAAIEGAVAVAPASSTTPKEPGTASAGSESAYARGDHVHPRELPNVTTADNGKFLRVVSGAWAAESIPNANGGSF